MPAGWILHSGEFGIDHLPGPLGAEEPMPKDELCRTGGRGEVGKPVGVAAVGVFGDALQHRHRGMQRAVGGAPGRAAVEASVGHHPGQQEVDHPVELFGGCVEVGRVVQRHPVHAHIAGPRLVGRVQATVVTDFYGQDPPDRVLGQAGVARDGQVLQLQQGVVA